MTYIIIATILILCVILIAALKHRRGQRTHEILPASVMKKKYGLYGENRPEIKINPSMAPENLRDLIPMAEKWGIGDDIIRDDFEEKATDTEKKEFQDALRGRTSEVTAWLDWFTDGLEMPEEAAHFMYMLEGLDETGLWPD